MKLATSTYVKIALIVVLCLGVCGFFGGCGRGLWWPGLVAPGGLLGCGAWLVPSVSEIDGVVQSDTPETTTEGSHFEVDSNEIKRIELNWLAGNVDVRVVPGAETHGKIVVDEKVQGGSSPVMVCDAVGEELAINYMEGSEGLSGCSMGWRGEKSLTVLIPDDLNDQLEMLDVEAASGRYEIAGVSCRRLNLGVASGELNATDVTAGTVDVAQASGRVNVEGSIDGALSIDQASGDCSVVSRDATPGKITGTLMSGTLRVGLPADAIVDCAVDKMSGSFTTTLPNSVEAGMAATCTLDFDMSSGNFTLDAA